MVLPIDEPSDALYRLITHELTHIFEFDIIPRSLLRRSLPLWVDEGLSDYMTGYWQPFDLMSVRDAAIADIVPSMSDFEGVAVRRRPPALQPRSRGVRVHRIALGQGRPAAVPLRAAQGGHRRRRERLRRSVPAEAGRIRRAVRQVPEGSVQAVPRQGAAGRLRQAISRRSAARRRTPWSSRSSPPPPATLMAVAAGNRKDQELDIVLMSTKDGKVIRNLTERLQQGPRLRVHRDARRLPEQRRVRGCRGRRPATASPTSRAPRRTRRSSSRTSSRRRSRQRIELKSVDGPESPDISPDGKEVAFAGLRGAIGDIFIVNIETERDPQRHQRSVRRLRADLCARRQVDHLPRARQRQRQAVPARPRHRQENADHVRHARRRRRAVHRRGHDRVPVDGDRSEPADRPGSRAQRQHLQHLDAEPEERRAEAVHRHA